MPTSIENGSRIVFDGKSHFRMHDLIPERPGTAFNIVDAGGRIVFHLAARRFSEGIDHREKNAFLPFSVKTPSRT